MFLGYKMSLLKWQEMAKKKSALGKKINFVHNAITQKKLGEETSQIGFEKMFKPITAKLDDVIASNCSLPGSLRSLPRAQPTRKRKAKLKEIDYLIGSILAGNTNVGIRNTGVGILDFLLKEGAINRSQHEKLFKNYFKP